MKQGNEIVFKKSVAKDLRAIPQSVVQSIQSRIIMLGANPFPVGFEYIDGYENHYRIRIGNYRVIYEFLKREKIVTIIKIGHRKDVYRKL